MEEPTSETKKNSRSSGSETLVYLWEKAEKDQELKLNEILFRPEELERRKKEIENSKQQQNQMFEYLQTQNSQLFLLLASKMSNSLSNSIFVV